MGCKASKYAISDEPEYGMEGYNKSGERNGEYPIDTDIIQTHRYLGTYPSCDNGSQRMQMHPPPVNSQHDNSMLCPSDAQFTKMAENCSVGFLEMLGMGSNTKMITNVPVMVNAYQHPAYNYQTPPSSELSIANSHAAQSRHSQGSQRKVVAVSNGSFSL
jgi:hypothetical protein